MGKPKTVKLILSIDDAELLRHALWCGWLGEIGLQLCSHRDELWPFVKRMRDVLSKQGVSA